MQAELSHLEPSKSDKSKVGTVHLKDGTSFPADVVLLAVGVAPRTEYLADHVELNKDKSVNVDKHFAVEGLSDVYAIGDIARCVGAAWWPLTSQLHRRQHQLALPHRALERRAGSRPRARLQFDRQTASVRQGAVCVRPAMTELTSARLLVRAGRPAPLRRHVRGARLGGLVHDWQPRGAQVCGILHQGTFTPRAITLTIDRPTASWLSRPWAPTRSSRTRPTCSGSARCPRRRTSAAGWTRSRSRSEPR